MDVASPAGAGSAGEEARRPRLRPDVRVRRHVQDGTAFYLVRHPDTQRYYRFAETEHEVLLLLDGSATLPEIAERFARLHPGSSLSGEALAGFVAALRDLDLLERSEPERRRVLYERLREERGRRRSPFKDLMFLQWKVYDPDRLFERLLRVFGFLWTPAFVVASAGLVAVAALLVAIEWPAFFSGYRAFLLGLYDLERAGANYLFMVGTWAWMTLIHESCHGMTCKRFGGEVHDVGLMLFYLQFPGCYCNVNDAWSFPSRARRFWVTFAGGYSGIVLAALAVFAWWAAPAGSAIHRHAFAVITLGFLGNVLSNFNPLVRFDGYYMLVDLVDVPNLQSRSFGYLGSGVRRRLLRVREEPFRASPRERRVLALYGTLSLLYLGICMTAFLVIGGDWLLRRFEESGWPLVLVLAGLVLERPARALAAGARRIRLEGGAGSRLLWTAAAAALALGLAVSLPLPLRVKGSGVLEPLEPAPARSAVAGRIVAGLAAGDPVRAGEVLATLENPVLVAEAAAAAAAERETAAQLVMAEAEGRPADAALLRAERSARASRAERAALLRAGLLIRAPAGGVVAPPGPSREIGRVVAAGDLVGEVLAARGWQLRLRVPERRLSELGVGDGASVQTAAYPGRVFRARVREILPARGVDDPQEALAAAADPTLRPRAFYVVRLEVDDPQRLLRAGSSAEARVGTGSRSLGAGIGRWLRRLAGERMWW